MAANDQAAAGGFRPALCDDWRMYCLDDCVVLFLPASQKLLKLNASAAMIWDRLARTAGPEACARDLSGPLGVTPAQALDYVHRVIEAVEQGLARVEPRIDHGALPDGPVVPVEARAQALYDLGDLVVGIDCAHDPDHRLIAESLEHLRLAHGRADHVVGVAWHGEQGNLVLDGRGSRPFGPRANLVPALADVLFALWYRKHADFIAIHAGLLRHGASRILLPGRSGSGKTTATAALLSLGAEYAADDVVALHRDALAARGFPAPLGIKRENVAHLQSLYPALRERRDHQRDDGRRLRYLPPTRLARSNGSAGLVGRIDRIVFPDFRAGAGLVVQTPSQGETLARLSSLWVRAGQLRADDVACLAEWIAATPATRITFGTPEQAVAGLREVLGAGGRT